MVGMPRMPCLACLAARDGERLEFIGVSRTIVMIVFPIWHPGLPNRQSSWNIGPGVSTADFLGGEAFT
jgi:hypothetical protein